MKSEQGENAMLVTAIIPQKKDPAKRNIFIDGEFAFSLIAQDVLYFKLREGEPIPQETYDTIYRHRTQPSIIWAIRCGRRRNCGGS